jgi:ElaB/YqjD/DUF883 family membrane-anchored ribosome-binding protein
MLNQKINSLEAKNAIQQVVDILEKEGYEVQKNNRTLNNIIKKYIRNNPLKAIGGTLLMGAILGWLWRH